MPLKSGPNMVLKDMVKVLENPWYAANNSFNIIAGFQKVGLFPLDLNWLQKNKNIVRAIHLKTNEKQFEKLRQKALSEANMDQLVANLASLNLFVRDPISIKPIATSSSPLLKRGLSGILSSIQKHHVIEAKSSPRKNCIGEVFSLPKILNESQRTQALYQQNLLKNSPKETKKRKNYNSSQPNPLENEEGPEFTSLKKSTKRLKQTQEFEVEPDKEITEIVYKKNF